MVEQGHQGPTTPNTDLSRRELIFGSFIRHETPPQPNEIPVKQDGLTEELSELVSKRLMTRRTVLKGASAMGVALLSADVLGKAATDIIKQKEVSDWERSSEPNDVFYRKRKNALANVELGTTFVPDGSLHEMGSSWGQWVLKRDKQIIKTVVEDFGIRNIRVGIRLDNVIDDKGQFTFDYYRWLFDYLVNRKVGITANVGMKSAGFPEVFIPDSFIDNPKDNPPANSVITLSDEISKRSLPCIENVCMVLEDYSDSINTVQPSNEPFAGYGPNGLTMGKDYVLEEAKILSGHFSGSEVLINDNIWNFPARGKAADLLAEMKANGIQNGVFGSDLYLFIPQLYNKQWLPIEIRRLDPFLVSSVLPPFSFDRDRNRIRSLGSRIIIAEGQAEPYGGATGWDGKEPGNSATGYRRMIDAAINGVFIPGEPTLLSIWRARHLAESQMDNLLTPDQREMIELTQMITSQKTA